MLRFILKRILLLIPVLIGVTFIVFVILSAGPPEGTIVAILGEGATEEAVAQLRAELGLDYPLLVRYVRYIWGVLQGDFGLSFRTRLSVADQLVVRFPNTAILATSSMLLAILVGVPLGVLSAKKQNTFLERSLSFTALVGVSIPNFWLGLMLVIIFALNLGVLPSQGMGTGIWGLLRSLILPAFTLSTGIAATIMRMTRSSMLETIRQDYVSTARAKGLKESQVTRDHMLKNALIPIITVTGLQFGVLLGGSVLTEMIFSWPGVGRYMLESILARDTPAVLGAVIVISMCFAVVNLIVDIIYAFVDPRIKSQYKNAQAAGRRSKA